MRTLTRTTSDNQEFQQLVRQLDIELKILDGEDHDLLSNNYLDYDLSPQGIRLALGLDNYHFADLSTWGHFGRHDLSAPWC